MCCKQRLYRNYAISLGTLRFLLLSIFPDEKLIIYRLYSCTSRIVPLLQSVQSKLQSKRSLKRGICFEVNNFVSEVNVTQPQGNLKNISRLDTSCIRLKLFILIEMFFNFFLSTLGCVQCNALFFATLYWTWFAKISYWWSNMQRYWDVQWVLF